VALNVRVFRPDSTVTAALQFSTGSGDDLGGLAGARAW
jgi:hypothetical protein